MQTKTTLTWTLAADLLAIMILSLMGPQDPSVTPWVPRSEIAASLTFEVDL